MCKVLSFWRAPIIMAEEQYSNFQGYIQARSLANDEQSLSDCCWTIGEVKSINVLVCEDE